MTLSGLCQAAHAAARERGWYDDGDRNVGELLMLVVTELSEAMEDARSTPRVLLGIITECDGRPEGFAIEIADAVIRIGDLCAHLGVDLEAAVAQKMAYNATRPYRHGGKLA